jgi:hypothetical protein
LVGLALLILGWWISSIVLPETRHRWFVSQISNLAVCLCLTSTRFWLRSFLQGRTDFLGLDLHSVSRVKASSVVAR